MAISASVKNGKWHYVPALSADADVRDTFLARRKVTGQCGVSFELYNVTADNEPPRCHPRWRCVKCYPKGSDNG